MKAALKRLLHSPGRAYVKHLTGHDHARQRARPLNERPMRYSFVFRWIGRLQPLTVLDVGTGTSALPALVRHCGAAVTAIDNVRDYWTKGMVNRHWRVEDEDVTQPRSDPHDLTMCISVLEHITDSLAAVRGLQRLTKPGGHIILTTPFGAVGHENVYAIPESRSYRRNAYSCRQSSPADLAAWEGLGLRVREIEYWRVFDSPYWSVGTLVQPPEPVEHPAQLACILLER